MSDCWIKAGRHDAFRGVRKLVEARPPGWVQLAQKLALTAQELATARSLAHRAERQLARFARFGWLLEDPSSCTIELTLSRKELRSQPPDQRAKFVEALVQTTLDKMLLAPEAKS